MSTMAGTNNAHYVLERRARLRFRIEQEVRYRAYNNHSVQVGRGKTLNMSSGGVLFTTTEPVPVGALIELSVDWPARLNDGCPLKIVLSGRAVRVEGARLAMTIDHYEFRTAGVSLKPTTPIGRA